MIARPLLLVYTETVTALFALNVFAFTRTYTEAHIAELVHDGPGY